MKGHLLTVIISAIVLMGIPRSVSGQKLLDRLTDFFEFEVGRNRYHQDTNRFVSKVVLAPVITYEPSTSLGMGIGGKLLFKPNGAGPDTRTSNIPASITYTLRNQFIFYSGYEIFFDQEKYLLKGTLEFSKFPLRYYGIGNRTTESDKMEISFDNFLIEPLLLKRIRPNLFVGGGIRYKTIYNAKLEEDHEGNPHGTSLQDQVGSRSLGAEFAVTFDSRDNVIYALTGSFLEFTHGIYGKEAGSSSDFMLSKLNFRNYIRIHPQKLNILALEWYARYAWGDAPPFELSELGGDELLRGFQEGRYRDRLALFAQAEYRWQALDRIGLVFFAGAGEVGRDLDDIRIDNLKYSVGTGIRIKIVKSENLNIRFDYGLGLGPQRDQNFYLGIAESF